jgi:hypothetical protein
MPGNRLKAELHTFMIGDAWNFVEFSAWSDAADLKIGDTAGLETCATFIG